MVRVVLLEEHGVELKRCESLNLMMTSGSFMGSQWCQCDKQTEENSSTFCFTSQAGTVSTYAKGQSMAVAFCLKAVSPRRVSFDPTNRDAGAERVAPQVSKWCPCRVDNASPSTFTGAVQVTPSTPHSWRDASVPGAYWKSYVIKGTKGRQSWVIACHKGIHRPKFGAFSCAVSTIVLPESWWVAMGL